MFRTICQSALVLLTAVPSCLMAQDAPAHPPPPSDLTSVVTIAPADEPGIRLTITGTIFMTDGTTPYSDVLLYVYQTDATGEYRRDARTRVPRLNGWLRTAKDGTYEIQTIRPASYPRTRFVAHIHAFVKPSEGKKIWIQDFLFADDPYLSLSEKEKAGKEGDFSHVLKTSQVKDGTLRAVRNIIIGKN